MDGRADVVPESGQRQLGRPRAAAELRRRLEDLDRESRARELDGAGEPVRARTDDDGAPAQEAVRAARGSGSGVSTRSSWSRRCS